MSEKSATTRRQAGIIALSERILGLIRSRDYQPGQHLKAQDLADRLQISRFPVSDALKALAARGLLRHEKHRGYFVDDALQAAANYASVDPLDAAYERIAADHLAGRLPERVSSVLLREDYGLTPAQISSLLSRIVSEGWAQRRTGTGWTFSSVLRTPEALHQTYRVRMAIEPAALLEPAFHMPALALQRAIATEIALMGGQIEVLTPEQLYQVGVDFHETVMEASQNPFFMETLRRVNQARRLIAYSSMFDRRRYYAQAEEHLTILRHIEAGDQAGAAEAMRRHLGSVVSSLSRIRPELD